MFLADKQPGNETTLCNQRVRFSRHFNSYFKHKKFFFLATFSILTKTVLSLNEF